MMVPQQCASDVTPWTKLATFCDLKDNLYDLAESWACRFRDNLCRPKGNLYNLAEPWARPILRQFLRLSQQANISQPVYQYFVTIFTAGTFSRHINEILITLMVFDGLPFSRQEEIITCTKEAIIICCLQQSQTNQLAN